MAGYFAELIEWRFGTRDGGRAVCFAMELYFALALLFAFVVSSLHCVLLMD